MIYLLYCSICGKLEFKSKSLEKAKKAGDSHIIAYQKAFGEDDHIISIRQIRNNPKSKIKKSQRKQKAAMPKTSTIEKLGLKSTKKSFVCESGLSATRELMRQRVGLFLGGYGYIPTGQMTWKTTDGGTVKGTIYDIAADYGDTFVHDDIVEYILNGDIDTLIRDYGTVAKKQDDLESEQLSGGIKRIRR